MRILFVTLFFPPFRYAGTELYTFGMAKRFQALGHDVEIMCAEDWDNGPAYWNGASSDIYQGLPIHRIHLNWTKAANPNKVLYDSSVIQGYVDKFLDDNQFDIVHATSLITLSIGILKSVYKHGIPLVLTLTDFWFLCPSLHLLRANNDLCDGKTTPFECEDCLLQESSLYKRITTGREALKSPRIWDSLSHTPINRIRGLRGMLLDMQERKMVLAEALELPDVILAPSFFLKKMFDQHNVKKLKVSIHGHDLSWVNGYSGKTFSDKLRFGYIGQIQFIKGIHVLVEAFKTVNVDQKATLDIWGDPKHSPEYSKELAALIGNDPTITMHGRYVHDDLAKVLSNIDVLVVPSIWFENQPLVIQEAFATRTPVITANVGGMAEAVHDEVNGLLFERSNKDDLARKMRRLIEEPSLVAKLSKGIPSVRKIEDEVNELQELYFELNRKRVGIEAEHGV